MNSLKLVYFVWAAIIYFIFTKKFFNEKYNILSPYCQDENHNCIRFCQNYGDEYDTWRKFKTSGAFREKYIIDDYSLRIFQKELNCDHYKSYDDSGKTFKFVSCIKFLINMTLKNCNAIFSGIQRK